MSEQLIDPFGGVLVEDKANEDRDPFGGVLVGGSSASKPNFSPSSFNATFQNPDETFYEDDLRVTPEWIQASKVIYRMNEGNTADALPSDTDYANYGLDFMGWFNSNIVNMGVKAHGTRTAKPDQAKAMLYLMDSYTAKGFSWEGTGRFFKGALTDPTNLVGLGTLGLGFVASKAAGALTKQGIRQALVEATKTGLIGAGEGAYISALDDYNRQVVETAVSGEDVDKGRLLKSAGTGLVLGGVLSGSLGYAGAKIGQKAKVKKDAKKAIEDQDAFIKELRAKDLGEEANAKVKEEIKAREEVAKKAEVKPEDTRGKGQQYHGTSTELGEFGEGHDYYSSMNIYGQGFYTTDALDVAGGYSKKGKGGNPTKYKVIKTNEANLYDLDKPLDDEALELLSESTEFGADWLEDMAPNPTVRDAFDELRDWSAGEGIPADEVQEMFDSFRYLLEQKGFQGYTHVGGGFTGTKPHKVEIFWNPKDHVRLEKIEGPKVDSAQPKVSTEAFSGDLDLLHGYSKSNREFENEMGEFVSLGPLEKFDPIGEFKGFRFDGDGGTFGDQGVYLEDTSNLFFNTPDMVGFDASELAHVKANFEKAFVLTPDTVKVFNKLTKKGKGKDVVEHLKAKGYDGIIVKGFDPNKKYGLADEGFTQSQVMHFKPETMEVVSTASAKDRDAFVSKINKNSIEAKPLLDPGSPNTPAGRTITALSDLRKSIAELVPEGKVVGLTVNNVQKYKELTEAVEPLKQILKEAGEEIEPIELLEHFEKFEMTTAQMNAMAHLVQRTASDLGDEQSKLIDGLSKLKGAEAEAAYNKINDLTNTFNTVAKVDAALAANTARTLGIRKLSKHKGEVLGVTIESLQKEGYTPSQAMQVWSDLWKESNVKAQRDNRVVSLKKRRDKAEASGSVAEFNLLQDEIDTLVEEIRLEELYKKNPIFGRMGEYFNKSMGITAEVMVSNVFSPSSVMINIVPSIAKSIYQPITDRVFQHGISRVAFKAALAEYSAMYSVIPSATKMAKTAWDLERSMLTGDSSKFLEDQTHIPKRLKGHWMRLFPRAMLASDAFFEQVLYRGHISGQAAGNAMEEGIAKGLKGKQLDDFVQKKVVKAVDESYEPNKNPMGVLRADGKSKGLQGEALDKHIEEGLEKYADSFLTATNEQGKDYVQRSLFKNAPSEKNVPSKALKWYEDTVKDNPWLRVVGQLFTRTPVRVFEEGVRMTPGFQFIHPSFVNDLAGVNGNLARVRAQRDVFIGQAITAWVFTKYVAGEATGQQTQDYKRGRQVEDAGLVGAYNFKLKDGSSINFRNLDPFSTPMKITLNALERYEELEYRKSQGEFIDASELRKAEQWMSVGLGSMYQAVRDANLTSGADEMIKVVEGFASGKEDVAMKFLGQVATRVLPNSWYKISMLDDPVLGDPKTIEQYLEYRINPQAQTVNKQHTALGQIRTSKNPIGGLIPLTRTTVEERKRSLSDTEAEAEEWLLHVAQVGDRNFAPPATKNPSVSYSGLSVRIEADLGEMLTTNKKANAKHGQETMYNRWMRYYRDTNPAEAVLATKGYALGTASNPNEVETMTSKIVNEFRAIGFMQLMQEEPELEALFIIGQERALKNEAGMNYQENTPITGTR